ncbi:MAG: mitochondrial fission ELM1 family protein [Rhodospirillales bacterium]
MTELGTVWALLDRRAGNRNQALGVAEALGRPFTPVETGYSWAARLPNRLLGARLAGLDSAGRAALAPPWPELVIAAGRRLAPAARWIKHQSGGRTRLCHIMDPGCGYQDFDLLAVPAHDDFTPPPGAAKVIRTIGAPNRVTPEKLRAAAEEWRGRLTAVPEPRMAVLTGGSTRRRRFTAAMARKLGEAAAAWARGCGGGLFIAESPRTGAQQTAALLAACEGVPTHIHRWGDGGPNPYMGYLGLCDVIVVTGESVSMCSEATAAGKPVFIFAPPSLIAPKHARLHQMLFESGHARPFEARLSAHFEASSGGFPGPAPLNAAQEIVSHMQEIYVK